MASFVVDNNVESTVADNPLAQASTTLNVAAGEGANFPSTFPFRLTIWDDSTYPDPTDDSGMEIVECTARSTDALTIVRGKEGSGDVAHVLGERVAILITAGLFNDATYGITTKIDGIATGADVTADNDPKSHGASLHTDRTRELFLCDPLPGTYGTGIRGVYLDSDVDEGVYYAGKLPTDFVSMVSANIIYCPASFPVQEYVILDLLVRFGTIGEAYDTHSNIISNQYVDIDNINVDSFAIALSNFTGITKDDYLVIKVERDADHVDDDFTADFCVRGISLKYTADM